MNTGYGIEARIARRALIRHMGAVLAGTTALPLLARVRAARAARAESPRRVVIAGAGMAGLCAAFELERLGHDVILLEASRGHLGGRVRTVDLGDGRVAEFGAMRLPKAHDLPRAYAAEFGLGLRPFVMGNPRAWAMMRGQRVRLSEIGSLGSLYDLTPKEQGNTPAALWDRSVGAAAKSLDGTARADLRAVRPQTETIQALDALSLAGLMRQAGLSEEAIAYTAVGTGTEQILYTAALENLREEIERIWIDPFDEIVGGTARLTDGFVSRLRTPPRMGCEVLRFEQDGTGVTVVYRRGGKEENARADAAVCTLPCTVMDSIAAASGFSGRKRRAIRGVNYDAAAKTFAVTRRRFWEQDDGIFGGGSVTDLPSGATYYPSDNASARDSAVSARPGVLLASYTWGGQARRQARMDAPTRAKAVMQDVARLHPQLAEDGMVERTLSWSWDRHRWSGGAYAFFTPGQQSALYADLLVPEGRVHFAGEHCSLDHSWIQGAMESALRAVTAIQTG